MSRLKKLALSSIRPSRVEGSARSSAARTQRMLREMGISRPDGDSRVDCNSGCSARNLGMFLEAQVEVERRLRAEAKKLADAVRKAWDEAEARTRAEIEFRIQAVRKAREESDARLKVARNAREDAERKSQEMTDLAYRMHGAAINQALSEMMARVQAEQQTITEQLVRTAAESRAGDGIMDLAGEKGSLAYAAFFVPRNRSRD